ncbi:MAG: hypothetical protein K5883_08590 [Pseudobutyrivibrio sp.]|nr:hypothetical protein [Pseudobutyrivibrio sp.]
MEISIITNGTEMMTKTDQNTTKAKVENKEVSQKVDSENGLELSKAENPKTKGDSLEMSDKYNFISKDGDTVELSETAESMNDSEESDDGIIKPKKKIISEGNMKLAKTSISDATLAKMSKAKLQQLLAAGQISRQQYNKAVKK